MTPGNGQSTLPAFTLKHVGNLDARRPTPVGQQQPLSQYEEAYEDNSSEPTLIKRFDSPTTTTSMIQRVEPAQLYSEAAAAVSEQSYTVTDEALAVDDVQSYTVSDMAWSSRPYQNQDAYLPAADPSRESVPYPSGLPAPPSTALVPRPSVVAPAPPPPDTMPGQPAADITNGYVPAGEQVMPTQLAPFVEAPLMTDEQLRRRKIMIYAGVGVGVAAGVGGLIWYLTRKKKKE